MDQQPSQNQESDSNLNPNRESARGANSTNNQDRFYPFRSWQALDEYKGFDEDDSEDELSTSSPNAPERDPDLDEDLDEEDE